MPKEGSNAFYRAYADRFYLDRANRDTYLARQAAGDLLTSGHLYLPTKLLKGLDAPAADGDAARKKYVDDLIALYLPLAGGTLTGDLVMTSGKTVDGLDISSDLAFTTLLSRGRFRSLPVNAGWTEVNVGSGDSYFFPLYLISRTADTPNSSTIASTQAQLLKVGGSSIPRVDWDKDLIVWFDIAISNAASAENTFLLQLKEASTHGSLAAKGITLAKINNLALSGEAYDTALEAVDLATAMTLEEVVRLKVVHTAGAGVEWFVNGVSKGTSTREPSGIAGATSLFIASHANGAAGAYTDVVITPLLLWQEY